MRSPSFFQLWRQQIRTEHSFQQQLLQGRVNVLLDLMQDIYSLHQRIVEELKSLSKLTNGANIEGLFRLQDCSDDILNRFESDIKDIHSESIQSEGTAIELSCIFEGCYLDRIAALHLYAAIVERLQVSNRRSLADYE